MEDQTPAQRTKPLILLSIIALFLLLPLTNIAQTYFNNDFRNDSNSHTLAVFTHPFADGSGYLTVGSVPMGGGLCTLILYV